MNIDIIKQVLPEVAELIGEGRCPICKQEVDKKFRDKLSEVEFEISGLCQKCQDNIFGK
jgi:hypothetical protein